MNTLDIEFYKELMKELYINLFPYEDIEEGQYDYDDPSSVKKNFPGFNDISGVIKIFLTTYCVTSSEAKKRGVDFSKDVTTLKDMTEAFVLSIIDDVRDTDRVINYHISLDKKRGMWCDKYRTAEIIAENIEKKLNSLIESIK